jgi:elongation factor Ts
MEITAGMVRALREKTGLPMMECKKALTEADGNEEQAIEILRKMGAGKIQKMASREAGQGRIACFIDGAKQCGAIVELRCETAPVANNEEFIRLANQVAQAAALANAPTAESARELPLPADPSRKIGDLMDEIFNRMRENMKIARVGQLRGNLGYYVHHNSQVGVLLQMSGACSEELKSDLCMHITALKPPVIRREEVAAKEIELQRAVFVEEAKGKPPQIIDKIVAGKFDRWYSDFVLLEQPFVKDDKQSVAAVLKSVSPELTVTKFLRYEVGGI